MNTLSKTITRSMLTWWIFNDDKQELPPIDTKLEIEHIFRFLKRFRLFSERYRARRKTFAKRFNLLCSIFNLDF